jgi:hypothetical protein
MLPSDSPIAQRCASTGDALYPHGNEPGAGAGAYDEDGAGAYVEGGAGASYDEGGAAYDRCGGGA